MENDSNRLRIFSMVVDQASGDRETFGFCADCAKLFEGDEKYEGLCTDENDTECDYCGKDVR